MNKRAIEKFSIQARRDLIDGIDLQLRLLGIDDQHATAARPESTTQAEFYADMALPLVGEEITWRRQLVQEIQKRAAKSDWQTARKDLIEEVAYTWFNRIIAIRFMEVNDYLTTGIRVLSSEDGSNEPEIMTHTRELSWQFSETEQHIIDVADRTLLPEDMDRKYRMLFLKQVSELRQSLPNLFEHTDDFMKLLFTPSYNKGVIKDLITQIPEADFDVQQGGQVEIIGWLYQYYNTEPHNKVVNINGGPVQEKDIAAATQLFTTDWVVRYMVDNSLGKYWLEHTSDSQLRQYLHYLLPGELKQIDRPINPLDLGVLDDAMGSGHILVYAFDVLLQIYSECGYSPREAARSIIENNLYGLEIDKRAYQLSYFALMMKVRQYDRHALTENITPKIYVFEDTDDTDLDIIAKLPLKDSDRNDCIAITTVFRHAQMFGSIIHLDKIYDVAHLQQVLEEVQSDDLDLYGIQAATSKVIRLLDIIRLMQSKYDVVVTNPPYLNRMDGILKNYVKKYYKTYSGDLFAVFIWLNINLTKENGYSAYMTPFVWMFIKTYENLRFSLLASKQISSLIQMEYSAFEEATVPINTFVLKNTNQSVFGTYLRLSNFKGGMDIQRDRVLDAIANPSLSYVYRTNQANFNKIPGSPIAYWASKNLLHDFEIGQRMDELVDPRQGMATTDNKRFIRQWFEVNFSAIKFDARSTKDALESKFKWFPYNKGGSYRKWYGNYDYVVNYQRDGYEIKTNVLRKYPYLKTPEFVVKNSSYYFREAITWPKITSGNFNIRYRESGSIHDTAGNEAFSRRHEDILYALALCGTKVADLILSILNPTINVQVGDFSNIPVLFSKDQEEFSTGIVQKLINTSKEDWDAFEISWDFKNLPMLSHIAEHNRNWTVEEAFNTWSNEAESRFENLKSNEEELNRIFIDLYGLQDELTLEVADKDVSIRRADKARDIKAFLSYFVGVVFGRYSLDNPGLAFAGGTWDSGKYTNFHPNEDDVILLTDEDYFGDNRDIIGRLKEFLATTFGADHLSQNLAFIANALGKKGDSAEKQIRSYFINDFYKQDHLSIYQKKPIYWQLDSGKRAGFRALFYLHRYDENTMAMIRTKYLHPLQAAYQSRRGQLQNMVKTEVTLKSKNQLVKRIEQLTQQLEELAKYDVILQHVANQHIALDLDDGVLVNHEKVQGGEKILTPIK